jgi:hypothetical protein
LYFIKSGRGTWPVKTAATCFGKVRMPRDEEVKMPTSDPNPAPHHSIVVEIGPDTTDEELAQLAKDLSEQMSSWQDNGQDEQQD